MHTVAVSTFDLYRELHQERFNKVLYSRYCVAHNSIKWTLGWYILVSEGERVGRRGEDNPLG